MKILEYKVFKGDPDFINDSINEHLDKGWELYGEPKTAGMGATSSAWDWIIQAVVRKEAV